MSEIEPTEFEATLKSLEGLTRTQITELVAENLSPQHAKDFALLVASLSLEALRLCGARALLRERTLLAKVSARSSRRRTVQF
jgi:hypothetical protein